jgi:hypothetical protein
MNKVRQWLEGFLFVLLIALNGFVGVVVRVIKFPIRLTVCWKKGHEWLWLGNGFFGMFAPKKPLKCIRCGKLGSWDEAKNEG